MPDWSKSMQRTYEFYIVDPISWKDKQPLRTVTSCSINRDSGAETLGSASFNITEELGECYIRTYLVTKQDNITERFCLGTHLVQTPSTSFDGKVKSITMDGYTPLIELKGDMPPIGYAIAKKRNDTENNSDIMDLVYSTIREHMRAPVIKPIDDDHKKLEYDYIANTDDTWMSYLSSLISTSGFKYALDDTSKVYFTKEVELSKMQPVWTFTDDNSSILLPDLTNSRDLYAIPNVVEVIYSKSYSNPIWVEVKNESDDSPISIQNRGRIVRHRVINPDLIGITNEDEVQRYAKKLLESLSTLEYTVTFSHGYCPVKLGDCVRLNYRLAGLENVKAIITNQSIECNSDCIVKETAVYTRKLWEA